MINKANGTFTENAKGYFYWADKRTNSFISFDEMLTNFCNQKQLHGWVSLFTDIRNAIVHKGVVLGSDFNEQRQNYLKLHHFCDRVILALLNWDQASGYYVPIDCHSKKNANECGINRIKFIK